jgi:hypothetical protein
MNMSTVTSAVVLAVTASTTVGQEEFYTTTNGPNLEFLVRLDPSTGMEVSRTPMMGAPGPQPWARAMTHDGSTLLGLGEFGSFYQRLFTVHPGDAAWSLVGNTPFHPANNVSLERHPVTGVLYATYQHQLFTLDSQSAQPTLVAAITGTSSGDSIVALAIDSTGNAYGLGGFVYSFDLATATATNIGNLWPGFPGSVLDVAFDSTGQLWGLHYQGWTGASEIYQIDLANMSATLMSSLAWPN